MDEGTLSRLVRALKTFDDGSLIVVSEYSRTITVNDWKENVNERQTEKGPKSDVKKGWTTFEHLQAIVQAGYLPPGKKIFVVIDVKGEKWPV